MRASLLFLTVCLAALSPARVDAELLLFAQSDRELYLAEAQNKVYLELRVVAPQAAKRSDPAPLLNVAFVLDRSASMAGPRIQAVREAVALSIRSFSPQDVVSVVTFGSEVETPIEARRTDALAAPETILSQIEPVGGAALYDALNQGAAQLRRYATPTSINRLILVTDGPATKGPRNPEDFARLAEALAGERITLSTLGIGEEFDEDALATLARSANGRFRYVERPEKLAEVLLAEALPGKSLAARDVTVTVTFHPSAEDLEGHGWALSTVQRQEITFRFPYVFGGQDLRLFCSGTLRARSDRLRIATARLTWMTPESSTPREAVAEVGAHVTMDESAVRRSGRLEVARTAVDVLISEAMQDAIENIDKSEQKRAVRALRRARATAAQFNEDFEDAQIDERIAKLDAYLAEVQARGLNQLDRKVLRSGLLHQFEPPAAKDDADR